MYTGQLVAVKYHDSLWYRARLLRSYSDYKYDVFLVDLGTFYNVIDIDNIRRLSLRFTKMPLQAFCGRVFGIHPYPEAKKWSAASCQVFSDLVKSIINSHES